MPTGTVRFIDDRGWGLVAPDSELEPPVKRFLCSPDDGLQENDRVTYTVDNDGRYTNVEKI